MYGQSKIYWSDSKAGKILRANLDGSNVEAILSQNFPEDLLVYIAQGKLYWSDSGTNSIFRMNFDGSGKEELIDHLSAPRGIDIDTSTNLLYFADAEEIKVLNLENLEIQSLIQNISPPDDIALDLSNGGIFWTAPEENNIYRLTLGDNNLDTILSELDYPLDIKLDNVNNKIYWIQSGSSRRAGIYKADFTGDNLEPIYDKTVQGIELDLTNEKIYWSERRLSTIRQANLDGTDKEFIVGGLLKPMSIARDPESGNFFWVRQGRAEYLFQADANGDNKKPIATSLIIHPARFDIDTINNYVYWVNSQNIFNVKSGKILRANLDNLIIETLIETNQLDRPYDIILDPERNKMYYTDSGIIKVANLDGSNIRSLFSPSDSIPNAFIIALDTENQKMYWTGDNHRIYRANLDGSSLEIAVEQELLNGRSIVLDLETNRIYWEGSGGQKIQRAQLDGSNIEDIFTVETLGELTNGLAIDLRNDKLYWSTFWDFDAFTEGKIQTANTNGTEAEDFLEFPRDLFKPSDIFIYHPVMVSTQDQNTKRTAIFPNPTNHKIFLKGSSQIDFLRIVDSNGRMLKTHLINKENYTLDISNYPDGIYYISVNYKKGATETHKIIKNSP